MNDIKCPNCGESYYMEGPSMRTAMYCPPIWKDGVNVNPDRNITTTHYTCLHCNHDFTVRSSYNLFEVNDNGLNKDFEHVENDRKINMMAAGRAMSAINANIGEFSNTIELPEGSYNTEVDIPLPKEDTNLEEIKKEIQELHDRINQLEYEVWELRNPGEWYDY